MTKLAALLLLAFLMACSPQPSKEADAAPSPRGDLGRKAEALGAAAPGTLAGEWRVAGIDGAALDEPYGIGLSADEDEIGWDLQCAPVTRAYQIAGQQITFSLPSDASERSLSDTASSATCAAEPPPRVADVMRTLDAADTISRTPENGILVEGGGHSLMLFSQ